jgi:hypothetical protein
LTRSRLARVRSERLTFSCLAITAIGKDPRNAAFLQDGSSGGKEKR